jgi:hypothetical protein
MKVAIRSILGLVMLLVSGCSSQQPTPMPVPSPSAELANLPKKAWTRCATDPNLRVGVYLWELPGLPPADPNSGYQGRRGDIMGELAPCTEVQALEYAWSATDKEYYVFVTTGEIKGWVLLHLVQFTEPPPVATTSGR